MSQDTPEYTGLRAVSSDADYIAKIEAEQKALRAAKDLGGVVDAVKAGKPLDLTEHVLELASAVVKLQGDHRAMEQAISMAFGEITRGFRKEIDALAKATGIDLPALMREQSTANTEAPPTPQ